MKPWNREPGPIVKALTLGVACVPILCEELEKLPSPRAVLWVLRRKIRSWHSTPR